VEVSIVSFKVVKIC